MYRSVLKNRVFFSILSILILVVFTMTPCYAKEVKLRLAHHFAPKDTWSIAADEFAKLVGQKSKGELVIKAFSGGQLGGERDYLEGLQLGTVDLAVAGPGVMANFDPMIGVFDLPFLYKNYAHANRVMDGPAGAKVFESYARNARIKILASAGQGFRYVLTKKKAIHSIEDIKGLKIRTPEAPTFVKTFQLIGANPTPVAWPEAYSAVETGVVDGMEGTPEVMLNHNFYELAKNVARTRHIMATLQLVMSMKTWDSLSEGHQNIIAEAANEIWINKQRKTAEGGNISAENKLMELGVEFTDPDLEPFRKAVRPLWTDWGEKYNAMDLVEMVAAMD
jgi:tripartite ATP-independent transporter DctP family solute receptor